jgi:tetratricopeptide (TPR) repeat protein
MTPMAYSTSGDSANHKGEDQDPPKAAVLNVQSLSHRVQNAQLVRPARQSLTVGSLSYTPWKLRFASAESPSDVVYPSFSYLDLRLKQNESWATSRLQEGVEYAKKGKVNEAEECYQEGLGLVPMHSELLVAYGALCANQGRIQEGIAKLEMALEADPNVPNAREFLTTIQGQQEKRSRQDGHKRGVRERTSNVALREDKAMHDALIEIDLIKGENSEAIEEESPLFRSDEERSNRKRKHKKKKHKKKRKKKKRRSYDSYSGDDGSASVEEWQSEHHKRQKKIHQQSLDPKDDF